MKTLPAKIASILAILIIVLNSCKKQEPVEQIIPIVQIPFLQGKYLFHNEIHSQVDKIGGNASFTYKNNKIVKRNGGVYAINGNAGISYVSTLNIYDTVKYQAADKIMLEAVDTVYSFGLPNKREIFLRNGLMVKCIYHDFVTSVENDTTYYFYDANNRIQRTEQYLRWEKIFKQYYFNSASNLEKRTTERWTNGSRPSLAYTMEEFFTGYDNTANPLKQYWLWEDIFLRSLSANNYSGYSYKKYDGFTGNLFAWGNHSIGLQYDNNGNIDFSK